MRKLKLISFALLLIFQTSLYAQPGFDDDVQDTPIDGGVSLLISGGLVYGLIRKKGQGSCDHEKL